jgi:ATP-dependent RNA helicase SUPV3L1/SUV3
MMSILGCSAGELGEVLKSLGFRLERRPIVAPPVEAPAAVAAPEATSETQTQPAEEAGTAVAATPESVEAPAAEPATSEATETAANGETALPQSETLAVGESEPQPETFEEIWRPRRHHRREGAHREGGREGRHRRGKPRYDRGTPASTPPAEGNAPPVAAAEANDANRRPDQRSDRPRFERRGGDPRPGENHARRDEGGKPRRDHEKRPNRQGDNRHGEGRRRDEARRSPQVVTAAPPKSGSAESSSPFAALAALKAQMEKRSEGSGST